MSARVIISPPDKRTAIRRLVMLRNFIRDRVPKRLLDLNSIADCPRYKEDKKCGSVACIAGWGIGMPTFKRDLKRAYGMDLDRGWTHLHTWLGSPPRVMVEGRLVDIFSSGGLGRSEKREALTRLNTFIVKLKRATWVEQMHRFGATDIQ